LQGHGDPCPFFSWKAWSNAFTAVFTFRFRCSAKKKMSGNGHCIAVFGTGSDVGKSVIATALCRYFNNKGIRVTPFKAQNMSNNSGVTPEGLEMGRAQIVQAEAARIPPHVDMNPVLLKPTSDVGSQVIVLGKVLDNFTVADYQDRKAFLFGTACEALNRLRNQFDLVVMEGAGSCAEVNLMEKDIVNFPMAEYADASVILVADIHKGGVFAQIAGTLECLPEKYRKRISGFIINRFMGDKTLFEDGKIWIEEKTKKPVFGILPWFHHFSIEAEDSVIIEAPEKSTLIKNPESPCIAVIRVPHISNFTDFDPLMRIDKLSVLFLEKPRNLTDFRAIILPGSKNTRHDLDWIKATGWRDKIMEYHLRGGHLFGVCGGFQMLGEMIEDPEGLEGLPGATKGLGILPATTRLSSPKTTTLTRFDWNGIGGTGYEIHMGRTQRSGGSALFRVTHRNEISTDDEEGCVSRDQRSMGTYVHGLFDSPGITNKWLESIGLYEIPVSKMAGLTARQGEYDLLVEHFEKHVDINRICRSIF
jgi:adenosylcobyric acid synthase